MNRNIDLTKILKNCPEGTEFWSDIFGKVQFLQVNECFDRPILVRRADGFIIPYTKEGWDNIIFPESCLLWPSKDCRDWSKFTAPWYKKEKFDPKTLKPFDKVLCKNGLDMWCCDLFSSYVETYACPNVCISGSYIYCIPYNNDTKHLDGRKEQAPDFYRYWEN